MSNSLATTGGNTLQITQQYPAERFNLLVPMQTVAEIADIHNRGAIQSHGAGRAGGRGGRQKERQRGRERGDGAGGGRHYGKAERDCGGCL